MPMKKTQLTDALRTIQKRFVSFLSIAFIIMLGTGGFFMTRYSAATLTKNATRFYQNQNFKDYELASSIGVSEADMQALREVEGIDQVEGAEVFDASLVKGSLNVNVTVNSWTDTINIPLLLEGSKPERNTECAIDEDFARIKNISIGDTIQIEAEKIYDVNPLLQDTYTVTAIVALPDDLRNDVRWTVVLPLNCFNLEDMDHRYTRTYLTCAQKDESNIFGSSYNRSIAKTTRNLLDTMSEMENDSLSEAKRLAQDRLGSQWEEAQAQIEDAKKQIADGEAELESQLAFGKQQLAQARAQLQNARSQLLKGEAQLRDAEAMLAGLKRIDAMLEGVSRAELLNFLKDSNALMRAYQNAVSLEERKNALDAFRWYINQEENRVYVELLATLTGIDLRKIVDSADSIPEARSVIDDVTMVIILVDASANGINPLDILSDMNRLDTLLNEINSASTEEARSSARAQLAAFLADPDVQYRLSFVCNYLGIDMDVLYYLASTDPLDANQINRLRAAILQIQHIKYSIVNAEKLIASSRAMLASGWSQYYAGVRLLQEKEQELTALETKARSQLADAKYQLEQKIKEAEELLASAQSQIDNMACNWVFQERSLNRGFFDISTNINAAVDIGYALGVLFLLIAGLVCFSTLIIIVEEERKLVGATKAFGFKNNEILGKYLIFSVTASAAGAVLGILLAIGITRYAVGIVADTAMYSCPIEHFYLDVPSTIIVSIGALVLCAGVTTLSCAGLLRSSAYNLMNGITQATKPRKQTAGRKPNGSLYSRLIIRNMINEKARVLISIIIIAGSCAIVGIGITLKYAFGGMVNQELKDVTVYDYRIDFSPSLVTEEERATVEKMMTDAGISWVPASYEAHLYERDDHADALMIISGDPTQLTEFVKPRDPKTNQVIAIPEHGILIQNRMHEVYGYRTGDSISILDSMLNSYSAEVAGTITNYAGRLALCSDTAYQEIFGTAPVPNCYYATMNGADEAAFQTALAEISHHFSPERADYFRDTLQGSFMLYNLIVAISIGIAIIMSFIILTNLANIFINRKKKELTVMRINGFSIKQTIHYLTRETIITVAVGLILGLVLGIILAPLLIRILESNDAQFIRSTNWYAWTVAVIMEAVFAFGINLTVFQKVKKLTFRDVAG